MPEALRGLYARRDALRAKIGDEIVSLSRLGQAIDILSDDIADQGLVDLEIRLRAVEAQIAAYQRAGIAQMNGV
jgi:hypothetical protein